ncbi:hypothetical protein FIBSPDRAFT_914536 [Athelia psychrophila]|uniref:CHAT domain-containing protein n=1 Tax=Athelia psychrophila TaxID=1759441 RepID=A0A167XI69_9AGAM|nr:hypothetical protein FIBSPDRAFT_914536 [Fibularhizoctonia sp. CBS 109695]
MDVHHRYAGHHDRAISLSNLGNELLTRFEELGQMADLEQGIIYQRAALELRPPGHPDRSGSLNNLANSLSTRFEQLGQMADLEQGIIYLRAALELCPPGHPSRSTLLNNIAGLLLTRFEHKRSSTNEPLWSYVHRGTPIAPCSLNNLANSLWTRFEQLAIIYQRAALELRPPGHPDRSDSLNNLANSLLTRFEQLGIIYLRAALELCPPGHPDHSGSLSDLANSLFTRFEQLAIIYQRDALELRPPGHPNRSTSLNNLAGSLLTRFEQLAIIYQRAALELRPPGHPDRSGSLNNLANSFSLSNLANSLSTRFKQLAIIYQRAALELRPPGHPDRSGSLNNLANSLLTRFNQQPVEAVRQYDSPLADRFKATSDELEALAISSQLRSDKLFSEGSHESGAASEARWKRQRELNLEREDIIQQIRRLPGFDHFLKAVPFNELRNAAAEGPVIIVNVAELRSDVIILHQRNPPIVFPMQPQNGESVYLTFLDLSKRLFEGRGQDGFSELLKTTILKQLDELLVTPVLEKLESLGLPKKSRVWWCPTSALCALPIHAAGKLPIKYVSSYTPTLSALISARKVDDQQPPAILNASESNPSLLAIVYPGHPPKTEDERDDRLHTVDEEYEVIKTAAQASQGRDVVRPDPTREAALAQLPYHRWAHFACHGRLDTSEPFKSAFELQGDSLSLSDLIHARLPNADFAFLAACDSATSGGITDTPDESLHLAAAVQFCGIRSVVGTLWPMADVDGPRVAEVFYKHMFKGNDSRKSAQALHKVVTTMRLKRGPWENAASEGEPLQRWANYIHIGA